MDNETTYLETIVKPLCAFPDEVVIEKTTDDRGILITLASNREDMGRIIGRKGDTARAIRRLLRQYGMTHKAHVALKIKEPLDYENREPQHQ